MPYATRDGVSLYYEHEGSGEPPFVFVHGWCCDRTFFDPQLDHFKSSHAVATLDLRGCGKSDTPEAGYDIPTLADDVAGLCETVGLARPVVVGHSLGGMIGLELAARYPSLPSAIVAVDPGPISPLPQTVRMFEGFAKQLGGPGGNAVRQAYAEGLFMESDDPDRRERILATMCAVPADVAASVIRGVVDWNGIAALLLCRLPVLVVLSKTGGSNDPTRLLALKPGIQIGVTVGTGHFNQLEAPEQVTPMIERFVSALP